MNVNFFNDPLPFTSSLLPCLIRTPCLPISIIIIIAVSYLGAGCLGGNINDSPSVLPENKPLNRSENPILSIL